MFVPYTNRSKLAQLMREQEDTLENMTGHRLKFIERGGTKLEDLLVQNNPWAGEICLRKDCFLCNSKEKDSKLARKSCSKRNLVYRTWCHTCREKDEKEISVEKSEISGKENKNTRLHVYIGETCRSAYERGNEHLDDVKQLKPSSHILKHLVDKHEREDFTNVDFRMEVLAFSRTAYERQILEACEIQMNRHHHIMNSKSEFNRSAIPRLGLKLGDIEYKEKYKEEIEEKEKEESLLAKIKNLRKIRNKERVRIAQSRSEPKSKRLKIDPEYTLPPQEQITRKSPEKRKIVQPSIGDYIKSKKRKIETNLQPDREENRIKLPPSPERISPKSTQTEYEKSTEISPPKPPK